MLTWDIRVRELTQLVCRATFFFLNPRSGIAVQGSADGDLRLQLGLTQSNAVLSYMHDLGMPIFGSASPHGGRQRSKATVDTYLVGMS